MKLYLGNLPFAASDDDIKEAFSAYGTIEDLFIPLDRETNRPRGFAFITLADDDLARKAIEEMDGADLMGRNLRVNEAEERRPQQTAVAVAVAVAVVVVVVATTEIVVVAVVAVIVVVAVVAVIAVAVVVTTKVVGKQLFLLDFKKARRFWWAFFAPK